MGSDISTKKVAELLKGTMNVLMRRFDQTDERIDRLSGRVDRLSGEVATFRDEVNRRFDRVEDKLLKNHEERIRDLETLVLK